VVRIAVALLAGVAALLPGRGEGQRIGLFFDETATVCTSTIAPFGDCRHIWVCAYIPPELPAGAVYLKMQLPVGIQICDNSETYPRELVLEHHGTLTNGVGILLRDCVVDSSPLVVAECEIFDQGLTPRNNMMLHLVGAPHDSVNAPLYPQIAICDPEFPEHHLGYVDAPSVDAWLNCDHECGCTTAVVPRTWAAVKLLYQGR
jgi:hypothetical protein